MSSCDKWIVSLCDAKSALSCGTKSAPLCNTQGVCVHCYVKHNQMAHGLCCFSRECITIHHCALHGICCCVTHGAHCGALHCVHMCLWKTQCTECMIVPECMTVQCTEHIIVQQMNHVNMNSIVSALRVSCWYLGLHWILQHNRSHALIHKNCKNIGVCVTCLPLNKIKMLKKQWRSYHLLTSSLKNNWHNLLHGQTKKQNFHFSIGPTHPFSTAILCITAHLLTHPFPTFIFLNSLNFAPCNNFVKQSPITLSVGQWAISDCPFFTRSVTTKCQISIACISLLLSCLSVLP